MHVSRIVATAGVAAVTAVGVIGCSADSGDTATPTSITIAVPEGQLQTTWDPAEGTTSLWFLSDRPVYEALLTWDDAAQDFAPWLAEAYEISDDGLTMTFTLRQDVAFSDGEPFTAEAAAKSYNASFEGGYAYHADVEPHAVATGEYTMELTTTKPLFRESTLFLNLTTIPIVSPRAVDDRSLVAEEPIGTGPYLLDEVVPGVSASYVRNPDYWNPEAYDFDEITIVGMADKVAALNALKSGQIDAAEIDTSLAAEAEASGLNVSTAPSGVTMIEILDRQGQKNPALADKRVRQALSYAIDRASIVEQIERGYGSASSQPFDPDSSEYVEGGDDRYAYDPDAARELLAEAGYADGFAIKLPSLVYGNAAGADYLPIVEQYLGEIGVTVEWVSATNEQVAELSANLEIDGVITHQIYTNLIYYKTLAPEAIGDPAFSEIAARYNGAPEEHEGSLDDAAEYILDQGWYVVIAHPEVIWASAADVTVTAAGGLPGAFLSRLAWFSAAD